MKCTVLSLSAISLCFGFVAAQQCTQTVDASDAYPAPSLAAGWSAHVIANDFTKPRTLKLDSEGHMLVVDQDEENGGVYRLTFEGEGPCLVESDRMKIISNSSVSCISLLNHGISKTDFRHS